MREDEFKKYLTENEAVLVYFSTPECNVCRALRPKIEKMLETRYPEIRFLYIDCAADIELAAQNSVFAVPTLVVFFNGRESIRKSRFVGVDELADEISRPYSIIFN